jgi:lantibiotic modifying enzyme
VRAIRDLLDLHRATGEERYLGLAIEGTDELISRMAASRDDVGFGLYGGLAGQCIAILETSRMSAEQRHSDGARNCFDRIRDRAEEVGSGVRWSTVTDIIDGSAGIGIALITADTRHSGLARRLVDNLLSRGTTDQLGSRWPHAENRVQPEIVAAQTGLMQGAAGIGRTLLRLDAALNGGPEPLRLPDSPF